MLEGKETPVMTQTSKPKTALVIGATGGIGKAVAKALIAHGWRLKALNRNLARAEANSDLVGVEWILGDAMDPSAVSAAAQGVSLIVHAANPPGYQDWDTLIIAMMQSSITAAKLTGARILLPGNIYNYGPDAGAVITETSPERPTTRKGKLRVEMERQLRASGAKALIVRAGDFFGPGITKNAWFAQMATPGKPVRRAVYPGVHGVGHAFAYLEDLALTMVRLVEQEDRLETYAVFNFGGHWLEQGEEMARAILRVAKAPDHKVGAFAWPLVALASPAVPMFRELLEMRYLWRRPLRLDNRKLIAFLGEEPHTPLDCALERTLYALGCLPADGPIGRGAVLPMIQQA